MTTAGRAPTPPHPEDLPRLAAAPTDPGGSGVRYVGYRAAERATERLAEKLLAVVDGAALRDATFRPIPRGGFVVLGMLAYALGLSRDQLSPRGESDVTVIVDDCALSGARFREALATTRSSRVVFAHLCSPRPLRRAIEAQECRVSRVVAAFDLADLAETRFDSDSERRRWHQRWEGRLGGPRYWIGEPEPVAFAWSEPERPFWNARLARVESGWRAAPPDRCLGNRYRNGLPPRSRVSRRLRVPRGVVSGSFEDVVLVVCTGDGATFRLEGSAAAMWRAVTAYGDIDAAALVLAGEFSTPVPELRADLDAFVSELVEARLLERA